MKLVMKESTKQEIMNTLNIDFDKASNEEILEKVRNNPHFSVSFKENGEVRIKRVLKG